MIHQVDVFGYIEQLNYLMLAQRANPKFKMYDVEFLKLVKLMASTLVEVCDYNLKYGRD